MANDPSIVGGMFEVKYNGIIISARGDFTINLGRPKSEPVMDSLKVAGFTEKPQAPFIKGMITDFLTLNVKEDITGMKDATITVKAKSGKRYMIEQARYTGDGDINMEAGTVQFEAHGVDADELI